MMTKGMLRKVAALAREVADLADRHVEEIDAETYWEHKSGNIVRRYGPNGAPDDATLVYGSKLRAALRRRTLDLTATLADLRRAS